MVAEVDPARVSDALARVRSQFHDVGRDDISIIAVTKSFGVDAIRAGVAAGCDAVGENYAQELLGKIREMESIGMDLPAVHFIGHLQSNKVRHLAPYVSVWQTVDRRSVADEIARRTASGAHVMVQVNSTGEETKEGCMPSDTPALVEHARALGLDVRGLMTIGPTRGSDDEVRGAFRLVRSLADDLGLVECSMGMSDDYLIAAECGSTMVRLGSVLFGSRPRSSR